MFFFLMQTKGKTLSVSVKRQPAAHSSSFDFLPTHKAKTKKPKELEFSQRTDDRNKK